MPARTPSSLSDDSRVVGWSDDAPSLAVGRITLAAARPRRSRQQRSLPSVAAAARRTPPAEGQAAAAVVHPGPVRRLLRRGRRRASTPSAGSTSQILEGGVDIVPQTVLAQGQADYAIAWVPKALASREQGAGITDVAQIFQRSGTYQVVVRGQGHHARPADLRGKKVGNWGFGNEFELFAGMTGAGLTPARRHAGAAAVRHAGAALRGDRRRAGHVLQRVRAGAGGDQPGDRPALPAERLLGDQLERRRAPRCCRTRSGPTPSGSSDPAYQDTHDEVHRRARSRAGPTAATTSSPAGTSWSKAGSKLGASHQLWQVNEVNKLIWPSPAAGAGTIDQAAWAQTVKVARTAVNADGQTVLTNDPDAEAYTNDYVDQGHRTAQGRGRRRGAPASSRDGR